MALFLPDRQNLIRYRFAKEAPRHDANVIANFLLTVGWKIYNHLWSTLIFQKNPVRNHSEKKMKCVKSFPRTITGCIFKSSHWTEIWSIILFREIIQFSIFKAILNIQHTQKDKTYWHLFWIWLEFRIFTSNGIFVYLLRRLYDSNAPQQRFRKTCVHTRFT